MPNELKLSLQLFTGYIITAYRKKGDIGSRMILSKIPASRVPEEERVLDLWKKGLEYANDILVEEYLGGERNCVFELIEKPIRVE